ncbi:hypothetical protein BMS3Abin05_00328 [bacterium BMS3Abin05]|nr:hypothetical protein BMS3Abin05_00328 [bacterium BMS3Abin05]GBE27322.1 hypothetical protein BMS3Bbin03_01246 [bacterium BMS3Bbin03]HDK36386.1 YicC family protein [Bacteroidota bacterium]HDZ12135.1 YicC family protein [Bacteroidota bacterium]
MIISMTGFGRGDCKNHEMEAVVEVRSVNNRFLDVTLRLPRSLSAHEQAIKDITRRYISRGRVSIYVALKSVNPSNLGIQLDRVMAKAYFNLLEELKQATGITESIRLEHLFQFSDIFMTEEVEEGSDEAWKCTQEALKSALETFTEMRREEGLALAKDMRKRIEKLNQYGDEIEIISRQKIPEEYEALKNRLTEILESPKLENSRLETEIAILTDKLDVTEECVRFKSHTDMFINLMDSDELVGRKLNFLLQEMNREVNTIGAKANCAEISHRAVFMKEEIEKIREQVQNVE